MGASAGRLPLVVGIAGGSGSGKTTIADALLEAVPGVALIQHDAYYRDRRDLEFEERLGSTTTIRTRWRPLS